MVPESSSRAQANTLIATPTRLQLALALTIVRSKPYDYTVREYILQLRRQISTPRLSAHRERQQRLNAAAFWQEQCKLLEADKQVLRDRMVLLERQNALLTDNLKNAEVATIEPPAHQTPAPIVQSKSQRKRAKPKGESRMRPAKRSKIASSSIMSPDVNSRDAIEEDFGALNVGSCGKVITESMWELQKLYRSAAPVSSALAYHIDRACASVTVVLRDVCTRYPTDSTSSEGGQTRESSNSSTVAGSMQEEQFGAIFRALARAYSTLLFGVTRLEAVESEKTALGSVLYSMVHMYDNVLELIAEDAARVYRASKRSSARVQLHQVPGKDDNRTNGHTIPRALADFLTAAASALDPGSASHQDLFEGFLFVLIDRLGKGLYLFTFGRSRANNTEEDLLPSEDITLCNEAKEIAQIEAPHLLGVLERVMGIVAQHLSDHSAAKGPRSSAQPSCVGEGSISARDVVLSQFAKSRLQQTLVSAVFGLQKEGDEKFSKALKMPGKPSTFTKPPTVEEQDIPSWYTKELWRLLGWEILANESDWE